MNNTTRNLIDHALQIDDPSLMQDIIALTLNLDGELENQINLKEEWRGAVGHWQDEAHVNRAGTNKISLIRFIREHVKVKTFPHFYEDEDGTEQVENAITWSLRSQKRIIDAVITFLGLEADFRKDNPEADFNAFLHYINEWKEKNDV